MVTFNSVGDIVSVTLLVTDLLQALHSSKGAAAEYQEVIRELYVLNSAFLQVQLLAQTHQATPELHALCEIAQRSVDKSRLCVNTFTEHIKKFESSLEDVSAASKAKKAARSVQWQFGRDKVDRFRAEITSHSNALHMLVATASATLIKVSNDGLAKRIQDSSSTNQASHDQQNALLAEIRNKIEENKKLVSDNKSLFERFQERTQWVMQLGTDLKDFMFNIVKSNLAIYQEVVWIRQKVETAPGWSLPEDPFILEDAVGRVAPVHLRFITSWKAFEAVIEARFEGRKGSSRIKRKQYVLQEDGTEKEIDRDLDWDLAFMPGQKINMSMIFRLQSENTQDDAEQHQHQTIQVPCPSCGTDMPGAGAANLQCPRCHKWFCRIVEVLDAPEAPAQDFSGHIAHSQFALPAETALAELSDSDRGSESDDDDFKNFMRIRIVERRRKRNAHGQASGHKAADKTAEMDVEPPNPQTPTDPLDDEWGSFLVTKKRKKRKEATGEQKSGVVPEQPDATPTAKKSKESTTTALEAERPAARFYSPRDDPDYYAPWYRPLEPVGKTYYQPYYSSSTQSSAAKKRHTYTYTYTAPPKNTPSSRNLPRYSFDTPYTRRTASRRANSPSLGREQRYYTYSYPVSSPDQAASRPTTSRMRYYRDESDREQGYTARSSRWPSTSKPLEMPRPRTKPPQAPAATEEDARGAGIPAGYSIKNWDPTEEPILLLGSVFDANSLGKWIYDWTVFHWGPATPLSEVAGELWLLLIQLAGKVKRAEETMPKILHAVDRDLVDDFLDTGERMWQRFNKLLKLCENAMWKQRKTEVKAPDKSKKQGSKEMGIAMVETLFSREHELERTEKLMTGIRLWSMRFDANCEEIIKHPSERHSPPDTHREKPSDSSGDAEKTWSVQEPIRAESRRGVMDISPSYDTEEVEGYGLAELFGAVENHANDCVAPTESSESTHDRILETTVG